MHLKIEDWGFVNGEQIKLFTIKFKDLSVIQVSNFGGIVHSWITPDRFGKMHDVLLGRDNLEAYLNPHPNFGCIIGRYANRISNGILPIGEKIYEISKNLNGHHLHGGFEAFGSKVWKPQIIEEGDKIVISLSYISNDGEEGYPGNLEVEVKFTFEENNKLSFEYFATTDQPTVCNLTNHCYFNLSGIDTSHILDHQVEINSKSILEISKEVLPTGKRIPIENTPFDFINSKEIGRDIDSDDLQLSYGNGYDHNFILDNPGDISECKVEVYHPSSGRNLKVYTTEPGIQMYTGNYLDGVDGKNGIKYKKYAGFCLETQHFPDSPHFLEFPSTLLMPGENYYSKTVYQIEVIN